MFNEIVGNIDSVGEIEMEIKINVVEISEAVVLSVEGDGEIDFTELETLCPLTKEAEDAGGTVDTIIAGDDDGVRGSLTDGPTDCEKIGDMFDCLVLGVLLESETSGLTNDTDVDL